MQVQKTLSQILETKAEGEIVVFEIPNPDIFRSFVLDGNGMRCSQD